jgi:RimJ/RimL family protein N-acetyltransferase
MIGDINLFLIEDEDCGLGAEVSVMIAESAFRGKGCAKDAVRMMMNYGIKQLHINFYFCKISKDNESSLGLFRR